MFNRFKKMIGSIPVSTEKIGNYFYHSDYLRSGSGYLDIELVNPTKGETLFKLNHYETNSMKIEINSLRGSKFYDLKKLPEYHEAKVIFHLFDIKNNKDDIILILEEEFAFFIIKNTGAGFIYYKNQKDLDIQIDIHRMLKK